MPASSLPCVKSSAQAARWRGHGADLDAALRRWQAFRSIWENAAPAEAASLAVEFSKAEVRRLTDEGVPADDPDLWRVVALPKHMLRA